MKKALIFDLDNTVYPVASIGEQLFAPVHALLEQKLDSDTYAKVQEAITRMPFQKVANMYAFSDELKEDSLQVLRNLRCDDPIDPYEDYLQTKDLKIDKFLVTIGFTELQWSKVKQLQIENDFKEIFIVDPDKSAITKKDIFQQIKEKYNYTYEEMLVIGDDPESEIAAATVLGIDTYLYDPNKRYSATKAIHHCDSFTGLLDILD
jgi:putative hydrolase of the HAD superfamily